MKPTVGRIVHFYPRHPGEGVFAAEEGPFGAMITAVESENRISLRAFPPSDGRLSIHRGVVLVEPGQPRPSNEDFAEWPAREHA